MVINHLLTGMVLQVGDKHNKDDKTHSEHKAPNTRSRTKIIMKDAGPADSPLKKAKNVFNSPPVR